MSENQPFRDRFFDLYIQSIDLITANVVWFILSIPLITLIPATGGLYHAMNRIAHGRVGNWRTVWEGFRLHFWLSWRWGLTNLVVFGVLWVNVSFYREVDAAWAVWVRMGMLFLFVLWGVLQLYTFPLLLEQKDRRIRTAVRNSLVLLLRRPAQTFGWAVAVFVLALGSSTFFPAAWIVLTASVCLYLSNRATLEGIARIAPGTAK